LDTFLNVGCTGCGRSHEVPERAAGNQVPCSKCGAMMQVPPVGVAAGQGANQDKQTGSQANLSRKVHQAAGPRLAIDFGTTRTKVAYWDQSSKQAQLVDIGVEVRSAMASAFYIPVEGTRDIVVGDDALDMVHTDPAGVVIGLKKEIHRPGKKRAGPGRRALGRVELASHLFRYIREYCEDKVFHEKSITECTLTVPVAFEQQKRQCIRDAAQLAGFTNIELVEEPVSAARHWLLSPQVLDAEYVIVCDVGGGTTDFALLKQEKGRFAAVPDAFTMGYRKGGNDLDVEIFENSVKQDEVNSEVVTEYRSGFLSAIRKLRERFSKTGQSNAVNIKGQSLDVAGNTVEKCVAKFVNLVYKLLDEFVRKCHEKVPRSGQAPILLVGGGSKIEGLKEKLSSNSNWRIVSWNQSDYAVALGTVNASGQSSNDNSAPGSVVTATPKRSRRSTATGKKTTPQQRPAATPAAPIKNPPSLAKKVSPSASAPANRDDTPPALSPRNASGPAISTGGTRRSTYRRKKNDNTGWIVGLIMLVIGVCILVAILDKTPKPPPTQIPGNQPPVPANWKDLPQEVATYWEISGHGRDIDFDLKPNGKVRRDDKGLTSKGRWIYVREQGEIRITWDNGSFVTYSIKSWNPNLDTLQVRHPDGKVYVWK